MAKSCQRSGVFAKGRRPRLGRQFLHKCGDDSLVSSEGLDAQQHDRHTCHRRYYQGRRAEGKVGYERPFKERARSPRPAELPTGQHRIHGYAHSPDGPISTVEWSIDSGASWKSAEVQAMQPQYSWARFEFIWEAGPGEYTLMTRATDSTGTTQPDTVPFNRKGYLFNQPLPHPISVT